MSTAPGPRTVLAAPHVPQLLGGSLLGRIPTAAAPLGIMLCALAAGATYSQAALLAAVYGLAATVGQPLIGRLVDRHGQRRPLIGAACLATAALLAFTVEVKADLPAAVAAAAVAGLATPPLEGVLRALWPAIVPESALTAAYGLDVAAQSGLFAAGPVLVSATAHTISPSAALMITAVLGLAGTLVIVVAEPSRRWQPSPQPHDLLGPLRSCELRRFIGILALVGAVLGAQAVAGTSWAQVTRQPTAAGIILAAFSAGSCVGGLAYGRLTLRHESQMRLQVLLVAFAVAWLPLMLCPANVIVMGLLAALPGLALSPLLGECFQSVGHIVRPSMLTEASSWLVAGCGLGSAVGTAAGGVIADATGPAAVYLAATLCAAVAAAAQHHHRRAIAADDSTRPAATHRPPTTDRTTAVS